MAPHWRRGWMYDKGVRRPIPPAQISGVMCRLAHPAPGVSLSRGARAQPMTGGQVFPEGTCEMAKDPSRDDEEGLTRRNIIKSGALAGAVALAIPVIARPGPAPALASTGQPFDVKAFGAKGDGV